MMLRLSMAAMTLTLLVAAGCASQDQAALQQKCNAGDQNACVELAGGPPDSTSAPSRYPVNPAMNIPSNVVNGQGGPIPLSSPAAGIPAGGIPGVGISR
jgi:hypothetical protein